MLLCDLPSELQEHILSYLSVVRELQAASGVCSLWRHICSALYIGKFNSFRRRAQEGSFVWRSCGPKTGIGSLRGSANGGMGGVRGGGGRRGIPRTDLSTPSPRHLHRAIFHGQTIYVHGGDTASGLYNDMFRYDILAGTWSKVAPTEGVPPTPRSKFGMVQSGDEIVLSGGCSRQTGSIRHTNHDYNDVHVYSICDNVWYRAGEMKLKRSVHGSVCLGSPSSPTLRLVLVGGLGVNYNMVTEVEMCTLERDESDHRYRLTSSTLFPYADTRMWHTQVKLSEERVFVFGGRTMNQEDPGVPFIRQDAALLSFSPDYTSLQISHVQVEGLTLYSGMYPVVVDDFVRVGSCLIYLQRTTHIKESTELPGFYVLDEGRKPTGEELYKRDFFHTFVLDIGEVEREGGVARWRPVERNPPLHAPRSALFHTTTLAGDSIVVFGGTVQDKRTKKVQDTNCLYRVTVKL